MKKTSLLVAIVAFSCFGPSSAVAQIRINSGQPRLAPAFVSEPTSGVNDDQTLAQEVLENPFDFLATEQPGSPASNDVYQGMRSIAEVDASPSDVDPASLPVGRRHRQQSMAETIIDNSAIASIASAGSAPLCWGGPQQTPHPVAEILLRRDCNAEALWNGYQAQRAAECTAMWNCISGHHGGCGNGCGCAAPVAGCNTCAPGFRNRYTQHLRSGVPQVSAGCDSLPAVGQVPCGQCNAATQRLPAAVISNSQSLQHIAPPAARQNQVASLPTWNN